MDMKLNRASEASKVTTCPIDYGWSEIIKRNYIIRAFIK